LNPVRKAVFSVALLLFLTLALALSFNVFPVKAESGVIYIRADGSVEPSGVPISCIDNVTYAFTGNINDSIMVERSNIIIDGNGYTLQGSGKGYGFNLTRINNVTIRNMNIQNFSFGIILNWSSFITVSANNISNRAYGIWLWWSPNSTISKNNIANHPTMGVRLEESPDTTFSGNNIESNNHGVLVSWSPRITFFGNNITDNYYGAFIRSHCDFNTLSRNNITNNYEDIHMEKSYNTTVCENNIANNTVGISIYVLCPNSKIFHNNFINNAKQAHSIYTAENFWDDDYPSGGNYWSNYTGVDTDQDGLGDTSHILDDQNRDNHPLMGPFSTFCAGTWNETAYNVDIISRSNIASFNFSPNDHTLTFDVEGENGTTGFCRITIPRVLMWCDDPNDWVIRVGSNLVDRTIIEDGNLTYIYFTYEHSIETVQIQSTSGVPEFTSSTFLLLIITVTLATLFLKRKHKLYT